MGYRKPVSNFSPRSIDDVTTKWGILGRVDIKVFMISAILALGFVGWGAVSSNSLEKVSHTVLNYLLSRWGWLYMAGVLFFVLFSLYLALSRYGEIKLGEQNDVPEYSDFSWFAMLFGCGMGVGLVFWSVAEPIYHYLHGPSYAGPPASQQSAEWALPISFFHWGISAWATFVIIGLAMGVILFRKRMPALISSCFYPILGDKIYGSIGKLIDIVTLVASLFGMATTIGLGVMQLSAGLTFNYGIRQSNSLNLIILAIVIACYLASACLPIEKGIKVGSNLSMIACILLLIFVFVLGPTKFILDNFFNATGLYIQNFFTMSLWMDPIKHSSWLGSWTIFYWAWWVAWAPFVGMFIAKISKGRTIREFVFGALIAPTILDMIFFGIFGSTALKMELTQATRGILKAAVDKDVASSIYVLLHQFPLTNITAVVTLFVIFTFFVVSADSCTIVLGMLSSGGDEKPKTSLKIFWGIVMGASAGVLMIMGGLDALQMASIVGAFPFIFIMFLICYCLVKVLRAEVLVDSKTAGSGPNE
ncbi:MAG TPA: BCCT family transporter [Desulfobacteria bacterium]|nr:BCCT family transporter [Desulfobacteria bacterium]